VFDPEGLLNPGKIFPTVRWCGISVSAIEPRPFSAELPLPFSATNATEAAEGLRALQAAGIPTCIPADKAKIGVKAQSRAPCCRAAVCAASCHFGDDL